MKYSEIIQNSALLDYQELPMWRVESRINENGIYECIWFWSNDGYCPNTINFKAL